MKNETESYVLTLNRDQALMVRDACELYARLLHGQFGELSFRFMNVRDKNYSVNRESVDRLLSCARDAIFGVGPREPIKLDEHQLVERETAWNIYQAVRYRIAWHDNPEGGMGVSFDKPYSAMGLPIPKCEVKE